MRLIQALAAAASLAAFPVFAGSPYGTHCKASADAFAQINTSTTPWQAVRIIGCPGVIVSEVSVAGLTTVMISWDGEGLTGANMNLTFQNGKLVSKSQFGLR